MKDLDQLRKLEHYMRREGFYQTAETARLRLMALGAGAGDEGANSAAAEAELESSLLDLNSWTATVK